MMMQRSLLKFFTHTRLIKINPVVPKGTQAGQHTSKKRQVRYGGTDIGQGFLHFLFCCGVCIDSS